MTINDIARLAGVSKKTVSKVLNHSAQVSVATRERVQEVIASNEYVPNPQARALALKRNFIVALVHDGSDRWALAEWQDGVADTLAGSEYALVVHRIDRANAPLEMARFVAAHRPAGVILVPPLADDAALAAIASDAGRASIRLGANAGGDGTMAVTERAGAAAAVARLVALGHRRIAMVAGPDGSPAAQQRELGFLDALADHDLDRGPALVTSGDFGFASGCEAGRLLLEVSPRPTAILAASDAMAAGVIGAATAAGLTVPRDLSVIGFGDSALAASFNPPLASVKLPCRAMAAAAAQRLTGLSEAQADPRDWPAELVERASLGPVPV